LAQETNETLTAYYRRLKTKATDCEFTNEDEEIKYKSSTRHETQDCKRKPFVKAWT
jgi:hypothetical protein